MQFDLKTKIGGGFAVLLVLFALAGGLSILNLRVQQATVHEIVENDMPMVEVLNTTAATLQLYRRAEKDMLLTIGVPDKQRAYHARLKSLSSEMRVLLGQLDKATAANEDLGKEARTLPAKALAGFEKYDAMLMPLAERLVAEGGLDVAQANALLTKEKDSVHGAEQALVQLQKAGTEMFVGNQKTMAALAGKTELTLLASVLCALLAGGIMAWLTVRSIVLPLRRIMDLAGAVAKGDLNARADGVFAAEMGELKASIEAMLAELKAKIAEADAGLARAEDEAARARVAVAEAEEAKKRADAARAEGMLQAAGTLEQVAGAVAGASEELAAQVEQSSRGTELQSGRAAETATAMEEMNATVLEVAKSAGQAAESAEQARSKAEEGSRLVIQVVEGIGAMQTVSASLREDMRGLGKQAEDIGRVLGVISDIADQTNLLALNAAIEAARAGDAGRGFAVVADEVRKLAEKTMTATREVGEAIRGIQEGTRRNLDGVERAAGMVEQATAMARKSGDALSEIVGLVESSTDQVRAIATASEEQSAASEEINRSVEDINRLAGENASAMRDAGQAVQELARQVQALRRLMDQLKRGG